ncbi:MAG TPA: hypothetical protein VFB22_01405 [Candidatus Baltobacteraceae bacterium]|nr:hypothetical protein [Candidatus Baltobacteraceae bacterium]
MRRRVSASRRDGRRHASRRVPQRRAQRGGRARIRARQLGADDHVGVLRRDVARRMVQVDEAADQTALGAPPKLVPDALNDRGAPGRRRRISARRRLAVRDRHVGTPVRRGEERTEPLREHAERRRRRVTRGKRRWIRREVRRRLAGEIVERQRGVPPVEGVRERRFPAGLGERVLHRKVDDALRSERDQLVERERRIARVGGTRRGVFRPREPAGLELALRERAAAIRAQEQRREVEVDAIVHPDGIRIALVPVAHRPRR